MNFSTLNGRAVPAFDVNYVSTTDRKHFFVRAIETRAPISTGGQPRQYAGVGRSVLRLEDGTITDDTLNLLGNASHDEFNDVLQGMVICNGPTGAAPTATTESTFIPILSVTF